MLPPRHIALLVLALPLLIATSAFGSTDYCSDAAIEQSGVHAEFNREQCEIFNAPLRTDQPQVGDTCVCESLLNTLFELGYTLSMSDLAAMNCDGPNFGDTYQKFKDTQEMKGRVLGGLAGLYYNRNLTPPDEAIDLLLREVTVGKVVAISLDPRPIYDEIAAATGIPYKMESSLMKGHALVIRSLHKNASGRVVAVGVIDSSGPGRKYWVQLSMLTAAYKSLRSIASRGLYISDAPRKLR